MGGEGGLLTFFPLKQRTYNGGLDRGFTVIRITNGLASTYESIVNLYKKHLFNPPTHLRSKWAKSTLAMKRD